MSQCAERVRETTEEAKMSERVQIKLWDLIEETVGSASKTFIAMSSKREGFAEGYKKALFLALQSWPETEMINKETFETILKDLDS